MSTTSEQDPLDASAAPGRGLLLFIVGDLGDVEALRALGCDLLPSRDGAEVFAALAAGLRPDLVVLDMRVPEAMDRAILAALQTEELEDVPVILLSDDEELRDEPGESMSVVRTLDPASVLAMAKRAHSAVSVTPSEGAPHEDDAPPSGPRTRARVLVVDDDDDHRDTLAETLRDAGYSVATAINGRDALVKTIAFAPELIILDLMMPVLDGWGFMDELQRTPTHAAIPVVVLTSGSPALLAAAPPASGYLRKPLDIAELLRTVRESLQGDPVKPANDPAR